MGKQDRIRHTAYMRLWRERKKHGLTGKVPKEELEREVIKVKMEDEGKRLKKQQETKRKLVEEKREKFLGIYMPESTKPKKENPFNLPFYEQDKEKKEEIVYQKIDPSKFSFLKDFFSGEVEKTILDKERKVGKIVHENEGMEYSQLMKKLEEEDES